MSKALKAMSALVLEVKDLREDIYRLEMYVPPPPANPTLFKSSYAGTVEVDRYIRTLEMEMLDALQRFDNAQEVRARLGWTNR